MYREILGALKLLQIDFFYFFDFHFACIGLSCLKISTLFLISSVIGVAKKAGGLSFSIQITGKYSTLSLVFSRNKVSILIKNSDDFRTRSFIKHCLVLIYSQKCCRQVSYSPYNISCSINIHQFISRLLTNRSIYF